MNFEHFYNRHKNLKLKNDEILRKWKMQQLEEEQRLFESAARRLQGQASVPAGVGVSGATTTGSSQLMVIKERGASTFSYYVYNYDTNSVNGPNDTEVSVEDYDLSSSNQYIIDGGGYLHRFYNGGTNDYAMQFYTAGGTIVDTIYGNTGDLYINMFDGKYIVAWDYDAPVVWAFDGTKVLTDSTTFENVDNYDYVSNWDMTCSNGFLLYSTTDVGEGDIEHKLYLGTADAITPIFTETASQDIEYTYCSRFESDKILIRKWDSNTGYHIGFIVIDTTGNVVQEITLTEETYNDLSVERFGTDKCYLMYYNNSDSGVDYLLYVYDSGADSLVTETVSRSTYPSYTTHYNQRDSYDFSNYEFSENMLFHFYHTTGNYGYGMEEVDYSKFVGFFEGQSDFVIADFADDETKYISSITFTTEVFLMPTDDAGTYSMLKFDVSGILSYYSFGIDSGLQDNINDEQLGDKVLFRFLNDDNGLWYFYMINSDASEFYFLDEMIEDFDRYYESDTVLIVDTDNNLAWYFNSVSTNWTSTDVYNDYYSTQDYTNPTRVADGNLAGFGSVNRIYYFNDMPADSKQEINCDITNGSPIIEASTAELSEGFEISGEGIPVHARIINIIDESSFEISVNATLTGTYTLYFREVDEISDGGNDMYDTGNILNTNLYENLYYTHTQMDLNDDSEEANISDFIKDGVVVTSDDQFGTGSSYFTNLYPGLFVLSASNVDITEFYTSGDVGSDGSGDSDNFTYTPTGFIGTYTAYIKRIWNAGDPSITQVMIVDTDGTGITHTPDLTRNNDDNSLAGLGDITKIHYLLFAKAYGVQSTETEIQDIINSYLTIVDNKTLSSALTSLNANYANVTSNLPSADSATALNIYRKTSVNSKVIDLFENMYLGKDIYAYWYYDAERDYKITIKVFNYSGSLLKKIDTLDESMDDFAVAENSVYLSTYTKYFDGDLYYVYNYNHLSPKGKYTATITVGDETNLRWAINDWVWWD